MSLLLPLFALLLFSLGLTLVLRQTPGTMHRPLGSELVLAGATISLVAQSRAALPVLLLAVSSCLLSLVLAAAWYPNTRPGMLARNLFHDEFRGRICWTLRVPQFLVLAGLAFTVWTGRSG